MAIHSSVIKDLSENEWEMLAFITNKIFPCCCEIDQNIIKSYKIEILQQQITAGKDMVKPVYSDLYNLLCAKFSVQI